MSDTKGLGLARRIAALFGRYSPPDGTLVLHRPFGKDDRFSFTTALPPEWPSDGDRGSVVVLYEDGQPLGPAHVPHGDVRALGRGRYSHWGPALYFSSSDNSDPNSNGRVYSVRPPPDVVTSRLPSASRA